MWNKKASQAFDYLTRPSAAPKVLRLPEKAEADGERPADKILEILESDGWAVHSDAELLNFLADVDVASSLPPKLAELIAEVLYFCWELDQE